MTSPTRRIRTRFAPSPTGSLHLGGLRTAFINYLFAKQHNGDFILRIEDTDQARNQENQIKEILDDLESLSLIPDESFMCPGEYGPYLQSQRKDKYKARITELLKKKKAYRCFCHKSELDKEKNYLYSGKCKKLTSSEIKEKLNKKIPFCIRLRINPEEIYEWEDYVRGKMSIKASSMGDIVLMRSNGQPTYNFASTVDDYEMKISDVFRGEEHLANTPYQLALYKAFGWEDSIPNFGHLSLIISESGKKISKRDPDSHKYFVSYFLEKGYYPEALLNYLLILGWTDEEREFFTLRESIENFSAEQLSSSPSTFDFKKLEWMSQSYLNKLDIFQYLNFVLPFFQGKYEEFTIHPAKRKDFAVCFRSRVKFAVFLEELAKKFYSEDYLSEKIQKTLKSFKEAPEILKLALHSFADSANLRFEEFDIRLTLKKSLSQIEVQAPIFYKTLRLALIGEKEGLPLHSIIFLLGPSKTNARLSKALQAISPE